MQIARWFWGDLVHTYHMTRVAASRLGRWINFGTKFIGLCHSRTTSRSSLKVTS